ncbi:RNase III domain-containing protein [Xylariaceae sp. FL0255]|nr:RNase III domain-containing protein [Xylariaceae sp. FL0255]
MTLKTSRSVANISKQALRQLKAHNDAALIRPVTSTSSFSTSASSRSAEAFNEARDEHERPRWSYTPERMKAPFSPHIIRNPARSIWVVNEDPKKLDDALDKFLGRDGSKLLPEELKWLAVTHKSFDQGRRGFNDRLSFLGRQICVMEATKHIITSPPQTSKIPADDFAKLRRPFQDPSLQSLDNLCSSQPLDFLSFDKVSKLAIDTGLSDVVRWKPRMPENLAGSGRDPVLVTTIYAIIGAIALQQGGRVASRVVRERLIKKIEQL